MKPLVSVIVPVFKVEDCLVRCLNSLRSQSLSAIEIILVDDASPDHSGEICEEYAKNDVRFNVIHQKTNQGLSVARNTGIKMASSDYLMFVDSDDMVHSDFCKASYECAIQNQADLVMFRYKAIHFINFTKIITGFFPYADSFCINQIRALDLLQGSVGHFAWNKLYKKDLFEKIFFPPGYFYEDWGTIYKTILKTEKIFYLDKVLYYYYPRGDGITSIRSEKVLKDSHELKMQQYYNLLDWGYPMEKLDAFLQNTALSYCIKKKEDWSDSDYVFCAKLLQACHKIPKGFSLSRKLLFELFTNCPALFDVVCLLWGKKCC